MSIRDFGGGDPWRWLLLLLLQVQWMYMDMYSVQAQFWEWKRLKMSEMSVYESNSISVADLSQDERTNKLTSISTMRQLLCRWSRRHKIGERKRPQALGAVSKPAWRTKGAFLYSISALSFPLSLSLSLSRRLSSLSTTTAAFHLAAAPTAEPPVILRPLLSCLLLLGQDSDDRPQYGRRQVHVD